MFTRRFLFSVFTATVSGVIPMQAAAQDAYPAKAVRFIVPYTAGGGLDTLTRGIGQHLSGKWGHPVVVENRGGASGMIGANLVAKSAPDGYTVLFSASSEVGMNVALFPTMPYDPIKDLAPVTLFARTPVALIVNPSSPIQSLGDLLKLAKAKPGQLAYATPGLATPQHFAGELLKMRGQVDMVHVPYKGAAPFMADMLAGHVTIGFVALPSVMSHIRSGKIRAVALMTAERSALLPQVPTFSESGLPQLEIGQWLAVFVPAGTSPGVIRKLNADIVTFIKSQEFSQTMQQLGADVVGSTPDELRNIQQKDIAAYRSIAAAAKIKSE